MAGPPPLPRMVVRLGDDARAARPVAVEPDAAARAAVAAHLGIPEVRKLRLRGRLVPEGRRDWRLDAELGATVVQECVVTLAPVTTRIDEAVERRYAAGLPAPEPGESEMPDDDSVEELPQSLDLFAVMVEALALALPAFPRAPGAGMEPLAVTEPGATPLTDEAARPFARLRGAMEGDDS